MADESAPDFVELTAELVAAYVANNRASASDVVDLIATVHSALKGLGAAMPAPQTEEPLTGAVSIRKSLADPERIVSMIDGKSYTTLKRHIAGHGYTPESYRDAFGLAASYPMTAPAYSERRRAIAHTIGLGGKPKVIAEIPVPKRRGRPKATPPAAEQVGISDATAPAPRRRLKIKTA